MGDKVGKPIRILLVEDNVDDVLFIRRAFRDANIFNSIDVVPDGEAALEYLRRRGPHASVERPGLVLLDLNLPKLNGQEVLRAVRSDPELADIPVIVLTSSVRDEDILSCYDLGIRAFMAKPLEPQNLFDYFMNTEDVAFQICERR